MAQLNAAQGERPATEAGPQLKPQRHSASTRLALFVAASVAILTHGTACGDDGASQTPQAGDGGQTNAGGSDNRSGSAADGGNNAAGSNDAAGFAADGGDGAAGSDGAAGFDAGGAAGSNGAAGADAGGAAGSPGVLPIYTIGGSVVGLVGTLVLQNNGGDDLTVSTNDSFTFADGLPDDSDYDATVRSAPSGQACTITNGYGTLSGGDVLDIAVSCVDKAWSGAELLELDDQAVGPPVVAFDSDGGATALWWQSFVGPDRIVRTGFDEGSSWGTRTPIDDLGAGASGDPDIVFGPDGTGIAVWVEFRAGVSSVRSSRFAAGAWGPAEFIETVDSGFARRTKVAVNASGDAVAVWMKDGDASAGVRYDIWANRFTAGIGWGTAAPIETDDTGGAEFPQVAIDASGDVTAVWAQRDASMTKNIWANRHTGASWGTAALLETSPTNADDPRIAMQANGDAIVVWASSYVWGLGYTAETDAWGTALEVSSTVTGSTPQIAFDASGHAIAVWRQSGNGDPGSIWANRYTGGTGWAAAVPVKANVTDSASSPDLAVSGSGDAVVTWTQYDGTRNSIWCNRYSAAQAWGMATLLETSDGNASYPQVALDADGDAVAVWQQFDGLRDNIWGSRFR